MTKLEIINLLLAKGYDNIDASKRGGIEVQAARRIPIYEFDYHNFVFRILEGKVDKSKIHFLDPWTFSIECE